VWCCCCVDVVLVLVLILMPNFSIKPEQAVAEGASYLASMSMLEYQLLHAYFDRDTPQVCLLCVVVFSHLTTLAPVDGRTVGSLRCAVAGLVSTSGIAYANLFCCF
jgi:hypothetical protein